MTTTPYSCTIISLAKEDGMSRFHRAGPAIFAVAAAAALVLGSASSAAASDHGARKGHGPAASLSFKHNRISSSTKPVIEYKASGLPAGAKLELQRTFGTAKVWKDVTWLKGHNGTKTIASVRLGLYSYRIKVYKQHKNIVFSPAKALYSYGRIQLASLCNAQYNHSSIDVYDTNNCDTQTVQVGGNIFTYLIEDTPPGWTSTDTVVKVSGKSTSCRSISIQFGLDNNAGSSDKAYVQVIQAAGNPQSTSVAEGSIGSAYFKLDGGPWYLNLATSNAYTDNEYVNAYLSCWSPTGLG